MYDDFFFIKKNKFQRTCEIIRKGDFFNNFGRILFIHYIKIKGRNLTNTI